MSFDNLFKLYGKRYAHDWRVLKAQVRQESAFNPRAVSKVGAKGLAQFMPRTFAEWSKKLGIENPDPYDADQSIHCQAAYMRFLIDYYERNDLHALMAYNWGMGNVNRWIRTGKHGDKIPAETFNYVSRIKKYYQEYIDLDNKKIAAAEKELQNNTPEAKGVEKIV